MTTQIEAMKMMVDALVACNRCDLAKVSEAIAALRAAIEAAEKVEPEWYYGVDAHMCKRFYHRCEVRPSEFNVPLYLHPPSAESEELRKDAARYRWLRDKHGLWFPPSNDWHGGEDADAAIDAAMEKQP